MNLANFTLHDQSEHMESWARYGFELDPRPRAPLIDFSDASWTEERILHEVRTSLQRIQADGFQAIMIGGLSNAMAYAWIIAHDMDLRVIMARTPRERTPDGKFIFRL